MRGQHGERERGEQAEPGTGHRDSAGAVTVGQVLRYQALFLDGLTGGRPTQEYTAIRAELTALLARGQEEGSSPPPPRRNGWYRCCPRTSALSRESPNEGYPLSRPRC